MHLAFKKNSKKLALAALVLFSLAVLCKITSLAVLPAVALLFFYFASENISPRHRLKFTLASALFFVLVNVFLSFLNGNLALHQSVISLRTPNSLLILLRDLLIAPVNKLFLATPVLSAVGFAAALLFLHESLHEPAGEKKFFKQALATMLLVGFFAFAIFIYQPPRYFYILFPALASLAALLFDRLFSRQGFNLKNHSLESKAVAIFSAIFIAYAVSANLIKQFIGSDDFALAAVWYSVFLITILACFFLSLKAFSIARISAARTGKTGFYLACLLFAAILVLQTFQYATWAANPSYSLLEGSTRLGEIAQTLDNKVAAGHWCSALALETDLLCQRGGFGGAIKESLFAQLGIELLLADESEWASFQEDYASYESVRFVLLEQLEIGRSKVNIFAVKPRN